jgi:hypothetical protein
MKNRFIGGYIVYNEPAWTTSYTPGVFTLRDLNELQYRGLWPLRPTAPQNLAARPRKSAIDLTWSPPATTNGTITGYRVFYTPAGGATTAVDVAANLAEGDIHFFNTSLLLKFDGSNNSTTFTDSSTNNVSITRNGSPVISTAQSKFGGSSALFNGSSYLQMPASNNYNFGTGDFTIEFWLYLLSQGTGGYSHYFSVVDQPTFTFKSYSGYYYFYANSNTQVLTSSAPVLNSWQHIALVRNGTSLRIYVNGVVAGSSTISSSTAYGANGASIIGAANQAPNEFLNGYLDDFRITKGVARYTSNFTPPASLPAVANGYTITGLTNNVTYTVNVHALNPLQSAAATVIATPLPVIEPVYLGNAFVSVLRNQDTITASEHPNSILGNAYLSVLRNQDTITASEYPNSILGNAYLSILRSDNRYTTIDPVYIANAYLNILYPDPPAGSPQAPAEFSIAASYLDNLYEDPTNLALVKMDAAALYLDVLYEDPINFVSVKMDAAALYLDVLYEDDFVAPVAPQPGNPTNPTLSLGNTYLSVLREDNTIVASEHPNTILGNTYLSVLREDTIVASERPNILGNAYLSILRSDSL